jgi:hypothetical protein
MKKTKKPNNGFIYVASLNKKFLSGATYSAISLKEYYPDAHITLFTIKEWVTDDLYEIFDNVIFEDVPNNKRAKLWALSRTPYDTTVYLDADTEIQHEDICLLFDQFKNDADIMLTKIRGYGTKISEFPGGSLTDHCGVFVYKKNDKTIRFMEEWYDRYLKQESGEWQWDTNLYPEELRPWDQWTYWWLQNKTNYTIKREFLDDDVRWNFVNTYREDETDKPIVVYHHTIRTNT